MEGESETIVRYTRLPAELRPVEIFQADTLKPIDGLGGDYACDGRA